jgi:hypothetical protein
MGTAGIVEDLVPDMDDGHRRKPPFDFIMPERHQLATADHPRARSELTDKDWNLASQARRRSQHRRGHRLLAGRDEAGRQLTAELIRSHAPTISARHARCCSAIPGRAAASSLSSAATSVTGSLIRRVSNEIL